MPPRSYGPGAGNASDRRRETTIFGHIIEVVIRPAAANPPTKEAVSLCATNGLIDTGASDVCIDYRLAEQLALPEIDVKNVGIVGATVPASVRLGVLEVPSLGFTEIMPLYAFKVRHSTHEVILGRSFLRRYIVTFDGPQGIMIFNEPLETYDEDLADG